MSRFISVIFFLFFGISFFCIMPKNAEATLSEKRIKKSGVKLLVLVIASDTFDGRPVPIYPELEKVWRSYMHLDPNHIEAYFIKSNPDLVESYQIQEDIIWANTVENARPGILNKTLLSLECLSNRLNEFDYVLRTNLSSFFVFPRLLQALSSLPRSRCYFGSNTGGDSIIGSGCGFVVSSDLAQLLVSNKNQLYDIDNHDDILIGNFLINQGIRLIPAKRIDFSHAKEWDQYKNNTNTNTNVFHFRIKNPIDSLRLTEEVYKEDLYVHYDMIRLFYNK